MKVRHALTLVLLGAASVGCSSEASEGTTDDDMSGVTVDEPQVCSVAIPCGEKQYCDYADDSCGADGQTGTCVPYPLDCQVGTLEFHCDCDGLVTNCSAADYSRAGGCELGPLQMACGDKVCSIDRQLCVELEITDPSAADAGSTRYYCTDRGLTSGCSAEAPCDCVDATQTCSSISSDAQAVSCEATATDLNSDGFVSSVTHQYTVSCVL